MVIQYQLAASARVAVELRETNGAVENLRLLQDPKSGVHIGSMRRWALRARGAPMRPEPSTRFNRQVCEADSDVALRILGRRNVPRSQGDAVTLR